MTRAVQANGTARKIDECGHAMNNKCWLYPSVIHERNKGFQASFRKATLV